MKLKVNDQAANDAAAKLSDEQRYAEALQRKDTLNEEACDLNEEGSRYDGRNLTSAEIPSAKSLPERKLMNMTARRENLQSILLFERDTIPALRRLAIQAADDRLTAERVKACELHVGIGWNNTEHGSIPGTLQSSTIEWFGPVYAARVALADAQAACTDLIESCHVRRKAIEDLDRDLERLRTHILRF